MGGWMEAGGGPGGAGGAWSDLAAPCGPPWLLGNLFWGNSRAAKPLSDLEAFSRQVGVICFRFSFPCGPSRGRRRRTECEPSETTFVSVLSVTFFDGHGALAGK